MNSSTRYRWFVVAIFFAFMLVHQMDRLLIAPMTTPIMETFEISQTQMGAVVTGALLVSAILYPVWGYLYDRFSRAKLLALVSAIWGSTTWLSAIVTTYPAFMVTRASTGVDDSSYPGIYSLMSDYFGPDMRGKVYGLLQLSQPLGYLLGMVAATFLVAPLGWRGIFYITGSIGLVIAVVILFGVREPQRGRGEPELASLEEIGVYRFERRYALGLFRKKSLLFLFAQGFVGVFPWNVITFWFFRYLEVERGYDANSILFTMAPAILVLAGGYFLGGVLGDFFFRKTPRGRILVALTGVLLGAAFLYLTMSVPVESTILFSLLLIATALFMPFSSPNVVSTVHDITRPEIRSTALSVQYFIENGGAAMAPLLAGIIADQGSLHSAILWICLGAWALTVILLAFTAYLVPDDIRTLREQMQERARQEQEKLTSAPAQS